MTRMQFIKENIIYVAVGFILTVTAPFVEYPYNPSGAQLMPIHYLLMAMYLLPFTVLMLVSNKERSLLNNEANNPSKVVDSET